jgi:hypothetical protein
MSPVKALLLFILTSTLALGTVAAGPIPPELVGEWVSPNARFNREVIANGGAIYLGANGFAAMIGTDETTILGMAGTATYDPKKFALTLNLHDNGTPPERLKVTITYDSKAKALVAKTTRDVTKEFYKRRQEKIPKWVIAATK